MKKTIIGALIVLIPTAIVAGTTYYKTRKEQDKELVEETTKEFTELEDQRGKMSDDEYQEEYKNRTDKVVQKDVQRRKDAIIKSAKQGATVLLVASAVIVLAIGTQYMIKNGTPITNMGEYKTNPETGEEYIEYSDEYKEHAAKKFIKSVKKMKSNLNLKYGKDYTISNIEISKDNNLSFDIKYADGKDTEHFSTGEVA